MPEYIRQRRRYFEIKSGGFFSKQSKTVSSASAWTPIAGIVHLQRTIGNQAVQRLFISGFVQAKLRIGQPNDIYQQEADRMADEVMRMPESGIRMKPT